MKAVKGGISVIIPTKGRIREVCYCLDSILKQTFLPDEIIIIDSSKKSKLGQFLKEKFPVKYPKISYLHSNVSLTRARNIGVERSSGEFVFFFDDDVILDKDYIKEVMKIFLNDKEGKVGGVTGRIVNIYRDATSLKNRLRRLLFLSYFGDGKVTLSGLSSSVQGIKNVVETEFIQGCAGAYRREVFKFFKFDERLGKLSGYCYMEDVDFSYRVSRKYKLIYTPFAKLEHLKSVSSRIDMVIANRQYIINRFYLFKKNMPKRFLNVTAFYISIFGLLLRSLLRRNSKEMIGILLGLKDVVFSRGQYD